MIETIECYEKITLLKKLENNKIPYESPEDLVEVYNCEISDGVVDNNGDIFKYVFSYGDDRIWKTNRRISKRIIEKRQGKIVGIEYHFTPSCVVINTVSGKKVKWIEERP